MDEGWLGFPWENSAEILVDLRRQFLVVRCSVSDVPEAAESGRFEIHGWDGLFWSFSSGMSGRVCSFFDGWLHALKAQRTESGSARATNKAEGKSLRR